MSAKNSDRQINVRGEIIIEGPARLIGSFTGIIAEGCIVTSGNVSIGDEAEVHTTIEPNAVAIQPGTASLTYIPAPAPEPAARAHKEPERLAVADQTQQQQVAARPAAPQHTPAEETEPAPPTVSFPTNQPQVPAARNVAPRNDSEDNAARQARARLAAYSRKAATGTDDPSGWAAP